MPRFLLLALALTMTPLAQAGDRPKTEPAAKKPEKAEVTTWDMHIAWPAGNFHTKAAEEFAKDVAEESGGTLAIKVHAGGSLGFKGQEILRVVRGRSVPLAETMMGNVEGDEPVFGLSSLPFVASSFAEAKALLDESRDDYEKALERHGLQLLYVSPWPPSGLFTKAPLKAPADLKGQKIRTYDAPSAEFVAALGGRGLAIPFSDLYTALSTGMVTGVLTSALTGVDAKLWEVTKVYTKMDYAYPLNMVVVNRWALSGLPASAQIALQVVGRKVEARQWRRAEEVAKAAEAKLVEHGMTVTSEVSPEVKKAMDEAAAKVRLEWLEQFKPDKAPVAAAKLKARRG